MKNKQKQTKKPVLVLRSEETVEGVVDKGVVVVGVGSFEHMNSMVKERVYQTNR